MMSSRRRMLMMAPKGSQGGPSSPPPRATRRALSSCAAGGKAQEERLVMQQVGLLQGAKHPRGGLGSAMVAWCDEGTRCDEALLASASPLPHARTRQGLRQEYVCKRGPKALNRISCWTRLGSRCPEPARHLTPIAVEIFCVLLRLSRLGNRELPAERLSSISLSLGLQGSCFREFPKRMCSPGRSGAETFPSSAGRSSSSVGLLFRPFAASTTGSDFAPRDMGTVPYRMEGNSVLYAVRYGLLTLSIFVPRVDTRTVPYSYDEGQWVPYEYRTEWCRTIS